MEILLQKTAAIGLTDLSFMRDFLRSPHQIGPGKRSILTIHRHLRPTGPRLIPAPDSWSAQTVEKRRVRLLRRADRCIGDRREYFARRAARAVP